MSSLSGLVDHRGKPIRSGVLTKEVAVPTLTGIRNVWHASVSSSLTPERLGSLMLEVDQGGDAAAYLTLAEEMEERDLHYHSVLGTRKLAVSQLESSVEAFSDDERDVEIADFVRSVVEDADVFRPMVKNLTDALGKGFSSCEIVWNRDGAKWFPEKYIWRDPRFFQFDKETGAVLRIRDESNIIDGVEIPAYKFLTHIPLIKSGLPARGGLARIAAVAYMCKGYSLKDWLAFAEVYGMPLRLGKYGTGASVDQKNELLNAVANLGTDAAAIIPESMQIEFMDGARAGGGVGSAVFERLANWLDKQVSKGVLGQTMTTDDGSSQSQATVHDRVRGDIRTDDAQQLSATLRRDLVKPLVDLNFGPLERGTYPKFGLSVEEPEDLESLAKSLPPFIEMGMTVETSVIRDKFGLPEPEEGAEVLKPKAAAAAAPPKEDDDDGDTGDDDDSSDAGDDEDDQGDDGDDTDDTEKTSNQAHAKLMRMVLNGEELTTDQRSLLVTLQSSEDSIDKLNAQQMSGWRKIINPILQPIIDLAQSSENEREFIAGLDTLSRNMDVDPLVQSLATATLKARGLGDKRDKV